jgi:hypothetical protein
VGIEVAKRMPLMQHQQDLHAAAFWRVGHQFGPQRDGIGPAARLGCRAKTTIMAQPTRTAVVGDLAA